MRIAGPDIKTIRLEGLATTALRRAALVTRATSRCTRVVAIRGRLVLVETGRVVGVGKEVMVEVGEATEVLKVLEEGSGVEVRIEVMERRGEAGRGTTKPAGPGA